MKYLLTLCTAIMLLFESCQTSTDKKPQAPTHDTVFKESAIDTVKAIDKIGRVVYPQTGHQPQDFLPKTGGYEIQYETKGDLNNDGLADIVIVLGNKKDKTAERPMLILLQNQNKTYRLDKVSNFAMPIAYNENDIKIYEYEEVRIDSGALCIKLSGIGPSGNLSSTFKYVGKNFVLTHIKTYNMGAGSHHSLNYDLHKGTLEEEIINTMEEDMPSKSKTFTLGKVDYLFENASPDDIITEAYKKIDGGW